MNDTLLSLFFKVLNMAVMFAFIAYLFKKYVFSALQHAFKHDHKTLVEKQQTLDELKHANNVLCTTIESEEEMLARLKKTVELWHQSIAKQVLDQEHSNALQEKAVSERNEQQAEMLIRRKQETMVMAQALERARHSLKQYFMHDESAARAYNETVITYVQKS